MARTVKATRTPATPAYRQRKGYTQAIVTLTDARTGRRRDYWLGEFGSRESREMYHRLIAAWEASDHALPDQRDDPPTARAARDGHSDLTTVTVAEVVIKFWQHAKKAYVRDEAASFKVSLRLLRTYYGSEPAVSFGPKRLRALRDAMVVGDLNADGRHEPTRQAGFHRMSAPQRCQAAAMGLGSVLRRTRGGRPSGQG